MHDGYAMTGPERASGFGSGELAADTAAGGGAAASGQPGFGFHTGAIEGDNAEGIIYGTLGAAVEGMPGSGSGQGDPTALVAGYGSQLAIAGGATPAHPAGASGVAAMPGGINAERDVGCEGSVESRAISRAAGASLGLLGADLTPGRMPSLLGPGGGPSTTAGTQPSDSGSHPGAGNRANPLHLSRVSVADLLHGGKHGQGGGAGQPGLSPLAGGGGHQLRSVSKQAQASINRLAASMHGGGLAGVTPADIRAALAGGW
jgi:hypothetical protein